jgi:hypothetical protein
MRRTLWLTLPLAVLLAVPVAAQDTLQSQVSVTVIPAHTQPARIWAGVQAIPVGNSGVKEMSRLRCQMAFRSAAATPV